MKIGINLVGVSYNSGNQGGRKRDFRDAKNELFEHIVNPLIKQGHDVKFYLYSYDNELKDEIECTYQPLIKSTFISPQLNQVGGGDKTNYNIKMMSLMYLSSLQQLKDEDLDLVISTRYDIKFNENPFERYNYDFTKCNFLWREPEYQHIPIINDVFIVFPHKMTSNFYEAIIEMETNPPHGCGVAMHNLYVPMVHQVGEENVQWVDDDFKTAFDNDLYKLTRQD